MRTRTATGAACGTLSLMGLLIFLGGLMLGGCGPSMTRVRVAQDELVKLRSGRDEQAVAAGRAAPRSSTISTPQADGKNRR
jgi:hypothetical protein